MEQEQVLTLVQDSLDSLQRSGMLEQRVEVSGDTVLLGMGSQLDSLAFVTFVTDLEDRVCRSANREVFLVLNDVQSFNADQPYLTAGILSQYVAHLTGS